MVRLMNHRHIQNPVKHLQGSLFAKIINARKKKPIADVRLGSKYAPVNITLHLTFFRRT